MTLEQALAELRLDPDFAALPSDWQVQLANQVITDNGFGGASTWGRSTPLTVQNIPQLAPQLMAEYNRVRANGDTRSWEKWAADHQLVDPNWLAGVQGDAPMGLQGSPEAMQALANWQNKARGFASTADDTTVPLEQDLLERTIDTGYADLEGDAARRKWAQELIGSFDGLYNDAGKTLASIYDGSRLRDEYAASAEAQAAQQAALAEQTAARRASLDTALAQMYAAQDPLNAERINAARASQNGVALAVQAERDRTMADFARDGYVGGSTGTDAALARTSIAGRQQAAELMGNARVQNASDMAGIGRFGATEGRSVSDFDAQEKRGINDSAAQRKYSLFSDDFTRRLANLTTPSTLIQSRLGTAMAGEEFGQSGFDRFMKNLNYFRTSGQPAPQEQSFITPVNDTMGSAYQNLGAGLVSLGGSLGNSYFSKKWSNPGTTVNVNSSPTGYFTPSGNVGVQTDWSNWP